MRDVCCVFVSHLQSLLLLAYLIRNGSERVVTSSRDHMYDLKGLEDYQHIDENGRDQGVNSMYFCAKKLHVSHLNFMLL